MKKQLRRILIFFFLSGCILVDLFSLSVNDSIKNQSYDLQIGRMPSDVTGQGPTFSINQKLASYLPVSPSSAKLLQEINYPINYCTGALNISIPLYEIKTRDFILPINLKCLTTGIKTSNWGAWLGVGWTLEAEPCVTREVRGKKDEDGYLYYNSFFGSSAKSYLFGMMKGYSDEKPDIFYFKTLSNRGKFVFKRPESSSESLTYRPIFFPASAEKVTVPSNLQTSIRILDEAGNTYLYGGGDSYSTEQTRNTTFAATTTWHATSITSPQKDQISFSYIKIFPQGLTDWSGEYDFYGVEDKSDTRWDSGEQSFPVPNCGYWRGVSNDMDYFMHDKREPDGKGGYIFGSFVSYLQNGSDYMPEAPVVYPTALSRIDFEGGHLEFTTTNDKLTKITVYEGMTLLRTINLIYNLYRYQTSRYKLDKVVITDNVKLKSQTYAFKYNEPLELHPMSVKYMDYWGYYNSHNENTDLVPRQTIKVGLHELGYADVNSGPEGTLQIGGANREPDMASILYTIKEVSYPSGEVDRFDFELNQYKDLRTSAVKEAGGLRIKKVSTYDGGNTLLKTRDFSYGTNGAGNIWIPPALELYQENHVRLYVYSHNILRRRYRIFSSQPCISLFDSGGAPVLYDLVTETLSEGYSVKKKTGYKYSNYSNYSLTGSSPLMFIYDYLDDWEMNQLLSEKEYEISSDQVVNQKEYSYQTLSLPASASTKTDVGDLFTYSLVYFISPASEMMENYSLYYNRYTLNGGQRKVQSSLKETRTEASSTIFRESLNSFGTTEYDIRTGNPVKVTETNSDGRTLVRQLTFPYHSGTVAAQRMVAQNDLVRPLAESYQVSRSGSKLTEKSITYAYDAATCGQVSYKLSALNENNNLTGGVQNVETYNRYDARGNLTEYTRKDGTLVTLLWGYNYQRLVAQIVGAGYSSVITDSDYTSLQSMSGSTLQSRLQTIRSASTALVTSFVWYLTRGIASKTDPMGNTTTYAYDGLGRLTEVSDRNGNILEKYEYNIKQ